jgi:hypothetical protein
VKPTPEDVARAVLRAYFDDPSGFVDMSKANRLRAVRAVEKVLTPEGAVVEAALLQAATALAGNDATPGDVFMYATTFHAMRNEPPPATRASDGVHIHRGAAINAATWHYTSDCTPGCPR